MLVLEPDELLRLVERFLATLLPVVFLEAALLDALPDLRDRRPDELPQRASAPFLPAADLLAEVEPRRDELPVLDLDERLLPDELPVLDLDLDERLLPDELPDRLALAKPPNLPAWARVIPPSISAHDSPFCSPVKDLARLLEPDELPDRLLEPDRLPDELPDRLLDERLLDATFLPPALLEEVDGLAVLEPADFLVTVLREERRVFDELLPAIRYIYELDYYLKKWQNL